jgi:hypothetical protein
LAFPSQAPAIERYFWDLLVEVVMTHAVLEIMFLPTNPQLLDSEETERD